MNQARVGILVSAALIALPLTALAQPKQPKGGGKAAPKTEQKDVSADQPATGAAQPQPADATAVPENPEGPAGPGAEGEGLGDICKIDPSACPTIDMEKAARRELKPPVYAVQQIYALKRQRFEINPYWGITLNDQFVSHPGPGLAINFYLINEFAIGINGNWYGGLNSNSDFNFQTSRAGRVGEPLSEYQWNANFNLEYVPAYGKFVGFSDFIFHWDLYVVAGVGAISTRPIAVIDPDNRTFDWKPKVTFGNPGVGIRIFFNRWFAAMLEVRDYMFLDELENPQIATGVGADGKPKAQDPNTWKSDSKEFTNNVQAQVGISIFLPFTWEYRLPK